MKTFVKSYFTRLIYSFLFIVDGIINLLIALIGVSSMSDLSTFYLMAVEAAKIERTLLNREENRLSLDSKYKQKVSEAIASLSVGDADEAEDFNNEYNPSGKD